MKTYRLTAMFIVAASLLAACAAPQVDPLPNTAAPTTEPTPAPQDGPQGPLPAAAQGALEWISDALGLPAVDLTIVNIEQVTFTDSCLGLGGPAESCLQAETPGFRIQVLAGNRMYTVHTNADGSAVRQVPTTGMMGSPEEAGQAAVNFLSAYTNQLPSGITVQSIDAVDFPDACLGVPIPNAMCAQVITPGYQIVLSAGGQTYEVRADLSGGNLALVMTP